jgi:BA14K-like protein
MVMKSLVKSILIAGAAVAIALAAFVPASANDWHHGNNNWYHRGGWGGGGWHHGYGGGWHHGYGGWGGGGWGYGAAGLATGLIIGSAIAQPGYYGSGYYGSGYYGDGGYAPPPRYYYGAPRRYYVNDAGLRPWSPAWSRYCFSRYRTFDGRTGTFVGNDGARHFCVAN